MKKEKFIRTFQKAFDLAVERGGRKFLNEFGQCLNEQQDLLAKLNDVINVDAIEEFKNLEKLFEQKEVEFYRVFNRHCGELKGAIRERKVKGDIELEKAIEDIQQDIIKNNDEVREMQKSLKNIDMPSDDKEFGFLLQGRNDFEAKKGIKKYLHQSNVKLLQDSLNGHIKLERQYNWRKRKNFIIRYRFRVVWSLLFLTCFMGSLISKIDLFYLALGATTLLWLIQEFVYPRLQEKSLLKIRQDQLRKSIEDLYWLRQRFLMRKSFDFSLMTRFDNKTEARINK